MKNVFLVLLMTISSAAFSADPLEGRWGDECFAMSVLYGDSSRDVWEFSGNKYHHTKYRFSDTRCTKLGTDSERYSGTFKRNRSTSDNSGSFEITLKQATRLRDGQHPVEAPLEKLYSIKISGNKLKMKYLEGSLDYVEVYTRNPVIPKPGIRVHPKPAKFTFNDYHMSLVKSKVARDAKSAFQFYTVQPINPATDVACEVDSIEPAQKFKLNCIVNLQASLNPNERKARTCSGLTYHITRIGDGYDISGYNQKQWESCIYWSY